MLKRLVSAALLTSLVACSRPVAQPPAAVHVQPVTANAQARVEAPHVNTIALLETLSVDLSADGTMLDIYQDKRLALRGQVHTVKKELGDGWYHCHFDFGNGAASLDTEGEYHGEGISLVDPQGKAKTLIEKNEKEQSGSITMQTQSSQLIGAVGTYLFLHEEGHFFGCGGAHPIRRVDGFIWNAATEQKVELMPPASVVAQAKAKLEGRGMEGEEARFVEAMPRFDEDGRLSVLWRFEKPTSYPDSEGGGSDYAISIMIESTDLPAALAQYREPPPAIRNYLANGGEPILGYTTL